MSEELTEIYVIYHPKLPAMAYKSNQIPRAGDLLHFTHIGCFRVKRVVYRVADDSELDGNKLMWVELFVEEYKYKVKAKHEERKCGESE